LRGTHEESENQKEFNVPRQSSQLEQDARSRASLRGISGPDGYRDCRTFRSNLLNWNTMSGFFREVAATTTVSASNFFSGDCHIARKLFFN
jgi:hypothetical protein